MEGRYDAIRGHRTGCYTSPPLSVPVSPSPVSREARRDFVAVDMWSHTRYQICTEIFWHHMVCLVYYTRINLFSGSDRLRWVYFLTFWIRGVEITLYSI